MLPKGLGNLGNLGNMVKQAMELKSQMDALKEQLGSEQVEASAGGGMVTATMTGKLELVSIKIDPEVINKDEPEMLETLVAAAVNEAARKAQELVQTRMRELTGGIDIPGITM